MTKSRIIFSGPYPPPWAGPEVSMKSLLESPLSQWFEISFLNTNVRASNADKGKLDLRSLRAFFSFIGRLAWLLLRKRPALVYHFVTATRLGWLGRDVWCIFISRLFGARVILHMRAGHFRANYSAGGALSKSIIAAACAMVARGIVQSESLRSQFLGLIPEERIVAIPNLIDCGKFCPDPAGNCERNAVLFLGHLSQAKGYCDLLKVIPDVVRQYPEVVFHFAGTKKKQERNVTRNQVTGEPLRFEDPDACFESHIRGRCEANYRYHGVADEAAKLELLKRCSFLVLPSYSEGFSMAVLEALAMGKPVLTTPVGALADVVVPGVNGLLADPGDLDALKGNILRLLSDRALRDRIAACNAAYVRDRFSTETVAKELRDCFMQAVAE